MKEERILDQETVLAILLRGVDWEKGLNFVSSQNDNIQVGTWGYNKGQQLSAHLHRIEPRVVQRTQEVLFVKNGRVKANIYSEERKFLRSIELEKNDVLVLLSGGHGFEVLEDNTQVLEIKNGPYVGAERDRERI